MAASSAAWVGWWLVVMSQIVSCLCAEPTQPNLKYIIIENNQSLDGTKDNRCSGPVKPDTFPDLQIPRLERCLCLAMVLVTDNLCDHIAHPVVPIAADS